MSNYKTNCTHQWRKIERASSGKNLVGEIVTATVIDYICEKCGSTTLKVLAVDDDYKKYSVEELKKYDEAYNLQNI